MKRQNAGLLIAGGAMLGFSLALCLGAIGKTNTPPRPAIVSNIATNVVPDLAPRIDWSRLKLAVYPNGGTGFFDPDTGIIYVYDADLKNCYLIQQLTTLGSPMRRPY